MPALVPPRFAGFALAQAVVGRPVSSSWEDAIAADVAFLIGRAKHVPIAADCIRKAHGTANFLYVPSPGAKVLLVTVGLHESATSDTTQTVTVSLSSAAALESPAVLDGSVSLACPSVRQRIPQEYSRIFDVSSLTAGTAYELTVASASSSGTTYGVRRVTAYEIPRAAFDPASAPSTEPGVNPVFGYPNNEIFAGSVSDSADAGAGMERVLGQLDSARAEMHRFVVNVATIESTSYAWSQASTASFTDLDFGVGGTPKWRTRARRLYAAAPAGYKLKVRVRYSLSGTTAVLRVKTSAGSTYDIALADTAGAWASVTGRAALDTSLTSQEDYLYFQTTVGGAGKTLYVSSLAVYDEDLAPADPLTVVDWTSSTAPSGLTYTRSGTWWLVSNAAQSALTSYAADTWGVELDALGNAGTVVVPGYTNALTAPRQWANGAGNWAAGLVSGTSTAAGPDGNAGSGYRVTLTGAQYGPYRDHGADAVLAYSGWFRANSGTTISDSYISNAAGTTIVRSDLAALTTTWTRKTILHSAGRYLAPADGTLPSAHSEDVLADCQQLVVGTTYCPPFTTGTVGAVTLARAGTDLVHGSHFDVDLAYVTAYEAATTSGATQYLLYLDANNHLALNSSHKFVLTLGGAAVCTSATQAYAAGAALGTVRVWNRSDSCGFTINGVTVQAASPGTTTAPGTAYVFSNAGANVFPCHLQGVLLARST